MLIIIRQQKNIKMNKHKEETSKTNKPKHNETYISGQSDLVQAQNRLG